MIDSKEHMKAPIATGLIMMMLAALTLAERKWVVPQEYPLYLLPYDSVQRDLGLSPAAVRTIVKVETEARRQQMDRLSAMAAGRPTVRPSRDQAIAASRKHDALLVAVLDSAQKARLKQIELRAEGINGLVNPVMSKTLQLTPDQIAKLLHAGRAREDELRKLRSDLVGDGHISGKNLSENAHRFAAAQANSVILMDSDAERILTLGQNRRWKAMMGKPFPIETLFMPQPALSVKVRRGSHH